MFVIRKYSIIVYSNNINYYPATPFSKKYKYLYIILQEISAINCFICCLMFTANIKRKPYELPRIPKIKTYP